MIYKRCSRCGKRLLTGTKCDCVNKAQQIYDKYYRDKDAKAFYASRDWIRLRCRILDLYGDIDVYELCTSGRVIAANTVHHIVPVRDDKSLALTESNLIPVSDSSHAHIHIVYNQSAEDKKRMQNFLREAIQKFSKENF